MVESILTEQYRSLYADLMGSIRRIVYDRDAAEDIVQMAFLKAWNARSKYDPNRGELGAWLNAIGTRLALQELEKRATRLRFMER